VSANHSSSFQPRYSTLFLGSGLIAGGTFASTVGSIGLVGAGGGMAVGALPMIAVGGIVGGAGYGVWQAWQDRQPEVLFVSGGLGAIAGFGGSCLMGGYGVAVAGTAFAVGPMGMAIAGGVLGLGAYGIYRAVQGADLSPVAKLQTNFAIYDQMSERLSEQILTQELLTVAMTELQEPLWQEIGLEEKFSDWEIESELAAIKEALQKKKVNNSPTDQTHPHIQSNNNSVHNPVNSIDNNLDNNSNNLTKNSQQIVTTQTKLTSYFAWGKLVLPNLTISAISHNISNQDIANTETSEQDTPLDNWQCIKTLPRHHGKINTILLQSDKVIITASSDRTVKLYDLHQQKDIFTCFGYNQPVSSLALSQDGQTLYTAGGDHKITVWDLAQQKIKKIFSTIANPSNIITYDQQYIHPNQCITNIALNPASDILATTSKDKTIRLWYATSGQLKRTCLGHQDQVLSLAFSSDGQTLVSGSADQTIRLWSVNTWQLPQIIHGHTGWVTAIALSPDGEILVSGSTDYTIKLWQMKTRTLIHTLISHTAPVRHLSISPNGKILASGSDDGQIKIWQLDTGKLCHTFAASTPVIFSQYHQHLLFTGNHHGDLHLWQPQGEKQESPTDQPPHSTIDHFVNGGEWWQILQVNQQADTHTVKLAYRRLARQYHPDVNQSTEAIAQMQMINQAYQKFLQSLSG
jgi:WD40 repeat protein